MSVAESIGGIEQYDDDYAMTPAQRVDRFISRGPVTQGVYEGAIIADGVYVSPGVVGPEAELPQVLEVQLLPGAQLGAGASHHQVMFGRVGIRIGEESSVVEAAIKPFDAASRAAEYEHDALIAARERGFDTFLPLGMAKDGDTTYLLTRKRKEPETLDNQNWTVSPSDTERYETEVVPNLQFMATTMGEWHGRGLFHGDAAPRNFARTDTGTSVVVDLENARLSQTDDEQVAMITGGERFQDGLAYLDATHGWYALTHPTEVAGTNIFLEGETSEVCMEVFEKDYLEPYIASMVKNTPPEVIAKIDVAGLRDSIYSFAERTT